MTRLMIWGVTSDEIILSEVTKSPCNVHIVENFGVLDTTRESPAEIYFSDGTVLNMWEEQDEYDPFGFWRCEIQKQGSAGVVIVPAETDDLRINTDIAFVTGPDLHYVKVMCEGEEMLP